MINGHKLFIIVAADENNGIGKDGRLPWHFKKEMKYFANTTTQTTAPDKENMVIMGRSSWESIDPKYRPLKNRHNIILTHQKKYQADGAIVCNSITEALSKADENIEGIFVIGGGKVFNEMIANPHLDGIYLTRIFHKYDCDTFLSQIPPRFDRIDELGTDKENGIEFDYLFYKKA